MTASRYRVFTIIAVALAAAVWVTTVGVPRATSATPTVGDYLVRMVRAMGLEGRVGPRAPVAEYLPLLVEQGVITADAARGLRTDQPLTRDVALEVSGRITGPSAPPFLSHTYVLTAFLAGQGTGLGLVSDGGGTSMGVLETFDALAASPNRPCPTPKKKPPKPPKPPCGPPP